MASQVLTADAPAAFLGTEEQVGRSGWARSLPLRWPGGVVLWGTLAVVALALLLVISRLLPKPAPPPGP
jgi:hypothetical protein